MLNPDLCYAAVKSRDARFDGRFFTGVLTTGIYCRPVCPARTPHLENVRFFGCAAAAEEAGLRPCLRCRPETAPGSPAWLAGSATVSRALRLIEAGALDGSEVSHLAARLGMGDRQLRRLFVQHLGAGPNAVAGVRRVQLAKSLIDQTDLQMSEIAFAAGFSSVRRFNAAFKASYHRAPTDLRRAERKQAPMAQLSLTLQPRQPFALSPLLSFLQQRATPGVERVRGDLYSRLIRVEGGAGLLEVCAAPNGGLRVRLPSSLGRGLLGVLTRVRRMFDVDADPEAIAAHLGSDPRLAASIERHPGARVPGAFDPFESAVRIIVGQQVSVAGATTLMGRITHRWGERIDGDFPTDLCRLPPLPEALADAPLEEVGMPGQRAGAIRAFSAAVATGALALDGAMDLETALDALCALPGVGPWTANMIAMRALGEPDAFPAGDLILRRALSVEGERLTEPQILKRAQAWRPWRAYAAVHLWASSDT